MSRSLSRAALLAAALAVALTGPQLLADPAAEAAPGDTSVPVVVRLRTSAPGTAARQATELRRRHGLAVKQRYTHAFQGFSASVPRSEIAAMRRDPAVLSVGMDRAVHVAGQVVPAGTARVQADVYNRVEKRDTTTRGDIAILDTGVSPHPDLNLYRDVDCTLPAGCVASDSAADGYGHGTLVAGVAAAKDNGFGVVGVAPGARIWNLKVFDDNGYGSISGLVSALDWVTARSDEIEVANLSLTAYGDEGISAAVRGAARKGVVVVAAAGNDGGDAAEVYPAAVPEAITVSAIIDTDGRPGGRGRPCETDPGVFEDDDTFLTWSNAGPVVDVAAPGGCVLSTAEDGGYRRETGTSFAAPHVAGAALLWIDKTHARPGPRRAAKVEAALTGPWSVPQDSRLGASGGRSSEPVLVIRGRRP